LVELLKSALGWLLIRSPPEDGCAVAEAAAGEMIVGHFDHVFRLDRLPLRRAFCRPSAGTTRSISGKTSIMLHRLQLVAESHLVLGFDTRGKSYMVKQAIGVVEPEKNRTDNL